MIIQRPLYIEKIKPFIDVKIVKILSGIRRCGKSTILEMIKQELQLSIHFLKNMTQIFISQVRTPN